MPRQRALIDHFGKLLDQVAEPVYLLDASHTILYGNRALADWMDVELTELIGRPVEYHSEEAPGIAAGLCPPPSVFSGRETTGHVSCMSEDGRLRHRLARFVPLHGDSDAEGTGCRGVIAMVASGDEETSVPVPFDAARATTDELHTAIRRFRARQAKEYDLSRLIGDNPAIVRVRRQVLLAAERTASVLIVGSPGSGRSHVARTIHYHGTASRQTKLIPLCCQLLTTDALHRTMASQASAKSRRDTTVLLLEDIDQMSAGVQLHLAERLSADGPNCRVLATSRQQLDPLVQLGTFRHDLACAVSTLVIELPPLRDRLDDLPLLAQLFVEQANRGADRQREGLSSGALDLLANYPWPGGIEELANVIRTAHRAARNELIQARDLPPPLHHAADALRHPRQTEEPIVLDEALGDFERALITQALDRAKGNKAQAARRLGLTRPRLYRRMVQLGLAGDKQKR
ncbi:MAG: helix-turn-helix domain-containing protein [Pirellulales bacterium]